MFAALISRTVLCGALGATALIAVSVTATDVSAADTATRPPATNGFHATVTQPTSVRQIRLPMAKSQIIDFTDDIHDILVSNPTIADAVVRSNRRLFLLGNAYGTTNVYVYGTDNRQIANIEIQVQPDVSTLDQLLRKLQPQSDIHVEAVEGAVVLTGSVGSAADATQAVEVAGKFLGAAGATTGGTGATPNSTGAVQVINSLAIRGKDQIMLRVTIAEVQRSAIKSLGIDLSASANSGNFQTAVTSTNAFPLNGTPTSGTNATTGFSAGGTSVNATVRALEQDNLLRVLSEPNLTAISGEEANFLVGGEFPIPISQTNGAVTVDFKKYGIGLDFIPVVLSEGRISLKVSTEVSELSTAGSVGSIPGLSVRRASSTVELSSGATLVMAGLISDNVQQALSGTPGLMNVPILGALFRSRDFQRTQTELAVFVQPIIVQPVAPGKLQRPDQNFGVAGDAATVFLGQLNRTYRTGDRPPPGTYQGKYGFIYE